MKILLLCEGDAETWEAWSGSAKSVLDHLRVAGHTVCTADIDLYGWQRNLALLLSFSPRLDRWRSKFHLGPASVRLRTRNAMRHLDANPDVDVILQIGATFAPKGTAIPYALYCDSNFRMAEYGAEFGYSDALPLTPAQKEAVLRREMGIYQNASRIFTISERLRRCFIEDLRIPSDRVIAVHAGPNLSAEDLAAAEGERSSREPTILFVGKQFERKGGDVLLRAFGKVRERIPSARLVVIGPETPAGHAAGVEWLGRFDKRSKDGKAALLAAYRNADVFCLPTRFEPFGIVFLEAMFFGLPCVGTDAWAVPEMIAEGETGYVVPINDHAALADRLIELLQDPAKAERFGKAARNRALQHFTWTAVVSRMLRALEPLLQRTPAGMA